VPLRHRDFPNKKSERVSVQASDQLTPRWGPSSRRGATLARIGGTHSPAAHGDAHPPRHRLSYSIPSTGKSSGTRTSESARGRSLRARSYVVLRFRRPSRGAPIGLLLGHTWIRSTPESGNSGAEGV